jgi:hypothetical protein
MINMGLFGPSEEERRAVERSKQDFSGVIDGIKSGSTPSSGMGGFARKFRAYKIPYSKSNVIAIFSIVCAIALFSTILASSYQVNFTGDAVAGTEFDHLKSAVIAISVIVAIGTLFFLKKR